ncbi:MAG: FAD-dependent oxidoreductase [Lachnospiraceae bacterium]|nr:FAD-dependent oxidoreductase [Lachnospiraceae bacterium]
MISVKYLILGAGPSGLTLANTLYQKGERSILLLEKEDEAGGLCRSKDVDGWALDIGGGHFLDVRRPRVNEFLFRFMPENEWDLYERDSRIALGDNFVSHPLEANIWQLPDDVQKEYLESVKAAGCNNNVPKPDRFVDWITWKLGERIAKDYMLPYNSKMFADELNELGTYWLEKLPNVDYEDILRSCSEHHAYAKQPGHASFYYPKKHGYGELWKRMGDELGDVVKAGQKADILDINDRCVTTQDGTKIRAEVVVTTVPWKSFEKIEGLSIELKDGIKALKHSSIETRYFEDNLDSKAQWIYYPDHKLPYHRILLRHNFCKGRGYWTETRIERTHLFDKKSDDNFRYVNEYAYPLNTLDKPKIMEDLLIFLGKKGIIGLGRWGEHSHYNSDLVVEKALDLAEKLG